MGHPARCVPPGTPLLHVEFVTCRKIRGEVRLPALAAEDYLVRRPVVGSGIRNGLWPARATRPTPHEDTGRHACSALTSGSTPPRPFNTSNGAASLSRD